MRRIILRSRSHPIRVPGCEPQELSEFEGDGGLPLWDVWVQELNDDLTGTVGTAESQVKVMSKAHFEAVGLFEREGRWYATGGPTCANCPVPIEYVSAPSPLGPWTNEAGDTGASLHRGTVIADNGCGGQNKGANVLPSADGPVVLEAIWGYRTNPLSHVAATDWDQDGVTEQNVVHGDNAQAISSTYWYPLEFDDAGRIEPLTCDASVRVPLVGGQSSPVAAPAAYQPDCRVRQHATIRQTGVTVHGGVLRLPVFQRTDELGPFAQDGPVMNQPLHVRVRTADGNVIERSVPASDVSWSPDEPVVIRLGDRPRGNVTIELSTTATNGCYGVLVTRDADHSPRTTYSIVDGDGHRVARHARLHIAP